MHYSLLRIQEIGNYSEIENLQNKSHTVYVPKHINPRDFVCNWKQSNV